MAQEHTDVSLADVRRLLDQFAASRADKPRKDVEAEYGDLLLYLILLAGSRVLIWWPAPTSSSTAGPATSPVRLI